MVAIFLALAAAAQAASVAAPLDLIDNLQVWIIFNQLSFFFDHLLKMTSHTFRLSGLKESQSNLRSC